ncbi:MAG: PAS domain-containing protein, partial [Firmicutes bacterium]|nr:PAS domain-containing protein [Bacillota bacterium]
MIKRDNAVIVYSDDSINDVWSSLKSRNASYGVVLTREEVPVGLVFLRDIAQYITRSGMTGTQDKVSLIMQRDFNIIQEKTPMDDFLEEDIEEVIFPIVVTQENGTYSEVITKEDLIRILYQNLQYTKRILDNIDEGIVAVDKDNNIAYMNESWKRIHSVNEDELIGASIAETFPESKLGTEDLESPNEPLHLNFTGATVI